MNYLRKRRNRYVTKIELLSALQPDALLISPPDGFTDQPVNVEYNGVYFTISSLVLGQRGRKVRGGTAYSVTLEFSFPLFKGFGLFLMNFRQLAEIKLTLNTGEIIRINKNDVALNKPIDVEFDNTLEKIDFTAATTSIFPLDLHE